MHNYPRKSKAQIVLEILQRRMQLPEPDKRNVTRLRKGYEGEKRFAAMLKKRLHPDIKVLHSILLKKDNSLCQIDTMICTQNTVYVLEIKNYYGDYFYQHKNFYLKHSETRIRNPLHQLQRTEDLLREHFQDHKLYPDIKSAVIFVHPEFSLYQAPLDLNVLFAIQIKSFLLQLNKEMKQSRLQDEATIEVLEKAQTDENHFEYIPAYDYSILHKGFFD